MVPRPALLGNDLVLVVDLFHLVDLVLVLVLEGVTEVDLVLAVIVGGGGG